MADPTPVVEPVETTRTPVVEPVETRWVEPVETAPAPWLVALDIDGTLLDFDNTLSDAVRDAVRDVVAAGHHVVLASGRSLISMVPVAERLGISDGWMVCSNGSVTVRHDDAEASGWTITEMVTFNPEPALRRLAEKMPGARFAVEDVGIGFRLTEMFPEGELDGDHTVVGIEDLWSGDVTRVVVRAPEATNEEFHAAVAALGLADVTYAVGWSAWMDIAPLGVTKASGLEKVRAELGVPPERTLAIGDGHNDVDMLRWAARGVAMGDADATVRAAASELTTPLAEDGAAQTLRTLLP